MSGAGNAAIFWVLGALFIAFGIYSGARRRRLAASEHTVPGEIVGYEEMADTGMERGSTGVKYHPIVQFQTSGGSFREMSRSGSSTMGSPVGTKVEVHARPDDPAAFEILSEPESARRQSLVIAVGVAFVAVGVVLAIGK
ncbi:DUF3592 domain-containing protein [Saccharibacillus sp. CPCC 101409]|uniref:DUF3592 domain-containing protein n=1 Tax=Saccharibacillus sp. CPCC 101409 TaxID=3058041 RepID=UPI0026730E5C|nr:DUF3592 domain-containing protein [Saccharibacillus sp. CPCC 101409]MDO3412213.1 DUF3592 domain-containing protein [Saccharibacillus sp. CPCC 101409]